MSEDDAVTLHDAAQARYGSIAIEHAQLVYGSILQQPVRLLDPKAGVCVRPETSLHEAVVIMNQITTGCVLVAEENRLVGIFTERDLLRRVVTKVDLSRPVADVMTRDPDTVRFEDSIAEALRKMHLGGYRHLPVVGADNVDARIISVRDITGFIVSLFPEAILAATKA